jgi:hypothetical protein
MFFNMTSFRQRPKAGTLRLRKFPSGLGRVTDVAGQVWDIRAIIGRSVCACKVQQLHPYYTDTSSFNSYDGLVEQEWPPYDVEVCPATQEAASS